MIASPEPEIRIENLRKTFEGATVLDGLSLDVRKSEFMAVIGPSGAGKSVLLRHLVGLLSPDSGRVIVGGVALSEAGPEDLERVRDRIGFLFQSSALLNSLTVFDNVALPLRERGRWGEKEVRDEVMAKLARVGLADHARKYPGDLSGGMRKRAGLARAIVGRRNLFLYDEPTAGLDPVAAASITRLLRELHEGLHATSIIVTHDLALVFATADRIAMLDEGRIQTVGTPEEIRASADPRTKEFLETKPGRR